MSESRRFRYLLLAASIAVFILILLGGIVSATGSAGACPDWPTCFGRWTLPTLSAPAGTGIRLDYLHRLGTALATPFILLAAWAAWRYHSRQKWISRPVFLALAALLAQIALGAWLALSAGSLGSAWVSALHLGLSLLMQAALLAATVTAFYLPAVELDDLPSKTDLTTARRSDIPILQFNSPFARLSIATLLTVGLLLVSGAVVAAMGAARACTGWPICLPASLPGWINLGHRFVVLLAAVLVVAQLLHAWSSQRSQIPVLVASTATTVLFFAQALMGARLVSGLSPSLLVLHQATAVAVWASLVVQVVSVGLVDVETPRWGVSTPPRRDVSAEAHGQIRLLRHALDFLMLTKPVVVALLLVITYAGMVIGAKAWPSPWLALWTLLGGFMAAGGSGAINQYIDRFDDEKMQRTQKRPIPAGRLFPGEGLAFGVGLALASFYLMAAMVNFLAALLTLAGIIYYVLIYSLLLKKTTVQNIVIGGGAGAIPPLVGWAAATGGLNVPSLFLFAVVFMWTPPHFWALALVRRVDYARAGVPMLPVVRGEKETRWQIFIYTLELVGLTLLLPLFGLGGSIYLVGAVALGGWLVWAAWRVWKQEGNKVAWKMYRYSSMYLAFLFVVLMVDRLLVR